MTEVDNIHQPIILGDDDQDDGDEEIDLLTPPTHCNNSNNNNNNIDQIRSDNSSLSKSSSSSLDQFDIVLSSNQLNIHNNMAHTQTSIPFFHPSNGNGGINTFIPLQNSSSFNNEEIMNLVQLLSCFPQPPSFVPTLINIQQQQQQHHQKSRRDTLFNSSSSLGSTNTSSTSTPHSTSATSLTSTPNTSMGNIGHMASFNSIGSQSNLNTSFGDLKFDTNTTSSSDSANSTPTKLHNPPPKFSIQIESESISSLTSSTSSSASPKLLKSNPEVSISYSNIGSAGNNGSGTPREYRLTPRSINFKPVDLQSSPSSTTTTTTNNNMSENISPRKEFNTISSSHQLSNSTPTTPTQPPSSSPFIGVVGTPLSHSSSTSSNSSSNQSTPTLNTIEVKQPPLSPEWEVNLNHVEFPPPLSINGDNSNSNVSNSETSDPLFEQLARSFKCEFPTSSQEHSQMLNSLLAHENGILSMYLDKCHEYITTPTNAMSQSSSSVSSPSARRSIFVSAVKLMQNDNERPSIRLSKTLISYGGATNKGIGVGQIECHPAPLNIELVSTITVSSTSSSKKVKFKVLLGPPSKTHAIAVEPMEGVLKKKESCSMTIRLTLKTSVRMRRAIIVEVEGGLRYYIVLHAETRPTPFGLPLNKCDMVQDGEFTTIPSVLVQLKRHILSNGGMDVESIFRLPPGDERTMMMTRERDWANGQPLTSSLSNDLHNSAALIKMWFRELRTPILSPIKPESFLQFDANETEPNESKIKSIITQLPEPNQTIFLWLIDLLSTISKNESVNKMSPKNFAVIISPNLYVSPLNLSPQDSLTVSTKVVTFLNQIIVWKRKEGN